MIGMQYYHGPAPAIDYDEEEREKAEQAKFLKFVARYHRESAAEKKDRAMLMSKAKLAEAENARTIDVMTTYEANIVTVGGHRLETRPVLPASVSYEADFKAGGAKFERAMHLVRTRNISYEAAKSLIVHG